METLVDLIVQKSVKILPLNCPGCGAALRIAPELETFACAYCGTSVRVLRQGGTVSLKRMADTVQQIRVGTDRVASELALARLSKELAQLQAGISLAETELVAIPSKLGSIPLFDYSFPLTLSGNCDYGALPRHELLALAQWLVVGVIIGLLFGTLAFLVFLSVAWWRVFASRRARVCGCAAANAAAQARKDAVVLQLQELRDLESGLMKQVRQHRNVVGATNRFVDLPCLSAS
jgi:hypothetical protein